MDEVIEKMECPWCGSEHAEIKENYSRVALYCEDCCHWTSDFYNVQELKEWIKRQSKVICDRVLVCERFIGHCRHGRMLHICEGSSHRCPYDVELKIRCVREEDL